MSKTIGRYQILEQIGHGGMGVVYRAFDPLLQRPVAVKVISAVLDGNPDLRERFFREARAAGQLAHKNIIIIHDLGEDGGQPYLAMECLDGHSLEARLRGGPLPLLRALHVIIEVCEGLEYAHAHGVIHRDIKPANIFITDSGQVKILDFGLARLISSELTRSQAVMGTANYMAPEQIRGEHVDQRVDVFAVGAVLYETLSGQKAFAADTFATTMYKILQEAPEPLKRLDPGVPDQVVEIIGRALAKSRDERFQNVSELLRDLAVCRESLRGSAPASSEERTVASWKLTPPPSGPSPSGRAPVAPSPTPAPVSVPWSPRRVRTTALMGGVIGAAVVSALLLPGTLDLRDDDPQPATTASVEPPAVPVPAPAAPPSSPPAAAAPTPQSAPEPAPEASRAAEREAQQPAPSPAQDSRRAAEERAARVALAQARQRADDARTRMAASRAEAESAGAGTLAATDFRDAVAAEGEATGLYRAGQMVQAAARFVEAEALFRGAGIQARAEAAARERVRRAEEEAAAAEARRRAEASKPAPPPAPPVESRQVPRAPDPPAVPPQQAIREVLAGYVSALEAHDIGRLRRLWPSLSNAQARALQAEVDNARTLDVQLGDPRIEVTGDTARAVATRRYEVTTLDGQRLTTTTQTTFTLRRNGTGWVIETIAHQQP